MKRTIVGWMLLALVMAAASCGGGSGQTSGEPNQPPSAGYKIVDGKPATAGEFTRIDAASVSRDPEGAPLEYAFALESPDGEPVEFGRASGGVITFTPKKAGEYTLAVTTDDGQHTQTLTDTFEVRNRDPELGPFDINAKNDNDKPAFIATTDETVIRGEGLSQVDLALPNPTDPDGHKIWIDWEIERVPEASERSTRVVHGRSITMEPDCAGVFEATVTVADAYGGRTTHTFVVRRQ